MRLDLNRSKPSTGRWFGMNARASAENQRLFTFTTTAPKAVRGWLSWCALVAGAVVGGASHPRRLLTFEIIIACTLVGGLYPRC